MVTAAERLAAGGARARGENPPPTDPPPTLIGTPDPEPPPLTQAERLERGRGRAELARLRSGIKYDN